MRIGAAVLGRFPLLLAHSLDEVEDFGKLPGWVDATGVEDDGVDGVGGEMSLGRKKRYRCYVPVTWRILCEVC
ncbi:hypothetical protein N7527_010600 [Penicillium freii]|nr:hypothetical protein N7527_010600 [Penicillium freii]